MAEHPDALRADFQQTYHLDLDGMGRDYTTLHAADLLAQLPEGARVWRAYDERAAWTAERTLLAAIVNDLNWLVWSKTKDGQRNRNRPKLVGPFEAEKKRTVSGVAMTVDELNEALSRPRGEVLDG